MTYYYY